MLTTRSRYHHPRPHRPPAARRVAVLAASALAASVALADASAGAASDGSADAAAADAATATPARLEPVTVTAPAPRTGYAAASSRSVLRSDAPLLESPQSVQVVTRELLDDRGSTKLTDVLGTVSGVNAFSFYADFNFRGFRNQDSAASVWNGIKAFGGVGFFHFGQDLANVERIEVLKGPSSLLFSSDQPGGTVNIVTKRPQATARHELVARAGRHDTAGLAGDFTGPLAADGSLLYRLNVAVEASDTFRRHQRTGTTVFAPVLTWRPAPDTAIDLELESMRDRRRAAFDRGIPAPDGVLGVVPPDWTASEPDDRSRSRSDTVHVAWRRRVDDGLRWEVAARWFDKREVDRETTTTGVLDADTVSRRNTLFDDANRGFNVTALGLGSFVTGALRHRVLFGFDAGRLSRAYFYDANAGRLDLSIRNPVYGLPPDVYTDRDPAFVSAQRTYNVAVYLQDFVEIGPRWRVLAGVRHERYRSRESDASGSTYRNDDRAVLPRLGVVYLPRPDWSFYGSLSRSFNPQYSSSNGPDFGGPFDPETGRQVELGSKWDAPDGRLSATVAVYRIVKRNVLVSDPADPARFVQTGEVRSRGFEIDVNGRLAPHWRINANYSYNDIEITRDTTGLQGRRTENAPRHLAGLFMRHDIAGTAFAVGGGLRHVGGGREDFARELRLPSYTLWNVAAYWSASASTRLQLNVDNLTDERHYVGSYGTYAVYPGAPRHWTLSLRHVF